MLIMSGLSLGMMVLMPMLQGGESPLSGIMEKVQGLFGGSGTKSAPAGAVAGGAASSGSREDAYTPRPLPSLPTLRKSTTAASGSGDRFPVGARGSSVRGMGSPSTTGGDDVTRAPAPATISRDSAPSRPSSSLAPGGGASSLAALTRERRRVHSDLQAALESGDRGRIAAAYEELRGVDDHLDVARRTAVHGS